MDAQRDAAKAHADGPDFTINGIAEYDVIRDGMVNEMLKCRGATSIS